MLGDSRPVVRTRAIAELGKLGAPAIGVLKEGMESGNSVEARRNAIWALTRIDGSTARAAVRAALADPDASVQQTALHSAGMHRDAGAVPKLLQILRTGSPHLRRNAATALGRIGDKSAVSTLLAGIGELGHDVARSTPEASDAVTFSAADRVMEHALIYALIEIGDRPGLRQAVAGGAGNQQGSGPARSGHSAADRFQIRAALIALDQMDGGDLTPSDVLPHLHSSDRLLKETASWIAGHHSEWGKDLADFFRQQLARPELPAGESDELQRQLVEFTRDNAIQHLIAQKSADLGTPLATRQLLLRVMAKAPLREMPSVWRSELHRSVADAQPTLVRGAVAVVRALPLGKTNATEFVEPLLRLAQNQNVPPTRGWKRWRRCRTTRAAFPKKCLISSAPGF